MSERQSLRQQDSLGSESAPAGELDLSPLLKTWENTYDKTHGIVRVSLSEVDGALFVRAFGACEPAPCDWGEVQADIVFADGVGSGKANAFTATYDFGYLEAHLQGNINKGLLILASFNRFKDGSGRADYFSREYFHR